MRATHTRWMTMALLACLGGCVTTQAPAPAPSLNLPPAEVIPPVCEPDGEVPLTLKNLLALAEKNHPVLAIARARIEAARGRLVQAGLYPNPIVTPRVDE